MAEVIHDFRWPQSIGADKFAAQHALAVDDVSLGKLESPVKVVALLVGIAHGEQVHVVRLQEILVCALVGVNAHGQHFNALAFHSLLHLHQGWHLFNAGRAPGGPEIQHDHLAAQFVEADFAVAVLDGEVRGRGPDAGRAAAAVTAGQAQGEDYDARQKHVGQKQK